jgi:hypothetical protein
VVGVPVAADVSFLVRVFAHLRDHRIAIDRREEAVDVDFAPAPRKGDVLLRRKLLVAERDEAEAVVGLLDLGKDLGAHILGEVDVEDFGAKRR